MIEFLDEVLERLMNKPKDKQITYLINSDECSMIDKE